MRNPFIKLTDLYGNTLRVNIRHIMSYSLKKFERPSTRTYTYILLAGGNALTRSVEETPEVIDQMIAKYYDYE